MNLHDRPLIEQMAVSYATEIERLQAEIARLRELKTPATSQLLNVTKALLDDANGETERLRAALEAARPYVEYCAENRGSDGAANALRAINAMAVVRDAG